MIRRIALMAVVVLAACQEAPSTAPRSLPAAASISAAGDIIPGQFIVTLRAGEDPAGVAASHGVAPKYLYRHALLGFAGSISEAARSGLLRDARVVRVEPDQVMQAWGSPQLNPTWGLDRVDQHSLPLNGSYSYSYDGSGVTAYIIDTGILISHSEFGAGPEARASVGYDAVGGGTYGIDCNGHGTHVAGTVGGTTYGVAKNVKLVAVRVLDCSGSGSTSGVIAGIDWVTAHHASPAVANMSLGGGASTSLDDAVNNSINGGVAYAVAAGNGNWLGIAANACNYSPARVPAAMTIGATDATDTKASWSNYGSCVDWFAPGVNITSAWYSSTTATNTISGTSMATPHTTGVAALVRQQYPGLDPQGVRDLIFANLTKGAVQNSKTTNNHMLYSVMSGAPVNQAPTAAFTYSCTLLTCAFTDGSTDRDGTIASRSWNFGDGETSTEQNPSHTYAAGGTYTVTLMVTDNGGATGTSTKSVTVSATAPIITLTAIGTKAKNNIERVNLSWSGSSASSMDIWRNSARIATVNNSGSYTDNLGRAGSGAWTYQVCEAGSTTTCSNTSSVTF